MPTAPPIKVPIKATDKYTKQFNKMTAKVKEVGRVVSSVGKTMTVGITAPILGIGVASVKMARDLNKSMANVGTLIPGQTEKLKGFKNEVMDLAVETGTASTTIAEGLYETISAFGATEDPITKLTIATKMSKAGLSSVTEALSLVSAVTKGYGDTSDAAAQKASDLAFTTVRLGQTTFPDLAASMGRVVPLAAQLNVKQEELFGSFATLTGVTGNAAEVSTQMSAIFAAMMKPSAALTKTVKKLGYASASTMMQEIGLEASLQKLSEATGGNSDKMASLLGRKEALVAAFALTGKQADTFTSKIKEMGGATGATEEAFKEQTDGIDKHGANWDKFTRRLERLAVKIGDRLLPIIEKIFTKLEPLIDSIAGASDETLDFGIKVAGLAATFGPLILGAGKAIAAFGTLRSLLGPGGMGAIGKLLGPIGKTANALDDVADSAMNANGALNTASRSSSRLFGKASKALGVIGKIAAKAGLAGGVGVAVGESLNQAVFDPQNQAYADIMSKAEGFSAKDKTDSAAMTKALGEAQKTKAALIENFVTTENVMGTFASWFSDVESPAERVGLALQNLQQEQLLLAKNLKMQGKLAKGEAETPVDAKLSKDIQLNQKTQTEIKVEFENMPEGVKAKVKPNRRANVTAKGAVMQGAF